MKNRQTRLNLFLPYNRTRMEKFFERRAAKGWVVDGLSRTSLFWSFHRTQPQPLHFAVAYPPPLTSYNPDFCENRLAFRALCEKDGWKPVISTDTMEIFCNESEDPVPLHTDAVVEIASIHRAMRRSLIRPYIISLLILTTFLGIASFTTLPDISLYTISGVTLGCLGMGLLILLLITRIIHYYFWYHKAKKSVEQAGIIPDPRGSNLSVWIISIAIFLLWVTHRATYNMACTGVGYLLIYLLISKLHFQLKCPHWLTGTLVAIVLVAIPTVSILTEDAIFDPRDTYADLPLTMEELISEQDVEPQFLITSDARSVDCPLMNSKNVLVWSDTQPYTCITYLILDVHFPPLYDWSVDQLKYHYNVTPIPYVTPASAYEEIDIDHPAVNTAYRLQEDNENCYLLCYDTRVVKFDATWDITPEQFLTICTELQP